MTSNDLKRGQVILLDTAPCLVLDVSSQSPSARGGSTLIKSKYRNLLTSQVLEKTFKASSSMPTVTTAYSWTWKVTNSTSWVTRCTGR